MFRIHHYSYACMYRRIRKVRVTASFYRKQNCMATAAHINDSSMNTYRAAENNCLFVARRYPNIGYGMPEKVTRSFLRVTWQNQKHCGEQAKRRSQPPTPICGCRAGRVATHPLLSILLQMFFLSDGRTLSPAEQRAFWTDFVVKDPPRCVFEAPGQRRHGNFFETEEPSEKPSQQTPTFR